MPPLPDRGGLRHRVADLVGPTAVLDGVRTGRRPRTFAVRWLYVLGLGAVVLYFLYMWSSEASRDGHRVPPARMARFAEEFFYLYAGAQFLAVCLLTPAYAAGAITDEKERKTLDFLLATQLTAREILFGKLGVRVATVLMFVLAGLPILAGVQFFGGIDPELLLLTTVLTLVTVVSLASVSLLASVLAKRTRDALGLTYSVGLAYLVVSGMWYAEAQQAVGRNVSIDAALLEANLAAAGAFGAGNPGVVADQLGKRASGSVMSAVWAVGWRYAAFHLAVAAGAFAVGSLRLRAAARAQHSPPRSRWVRVLSGERTAARRHPPVGDDAMFWKEVYVEPGAGSRLTSRVAAAVVVTAVVVSFGSALLDALAYSRYSTPGAILRERINTWVMVISSGFGSIVLLRAAVTAAGAVTREKERDTAVSLQTTPLTAREVVAGKLWGAALGQRKSLYLLAGVWAVGVLTGAVSVLGAMAWAVAFPVYLAGYSALGLYCSTKARTTLAATVSAVAAALFFSGGFWAFIGCCCAAGSVGGPFRDFPEWLAVLLGSFAVSLTPPAVLALVGLPPDNLERAFRRDFDGGKLVAGVIGASAALAVWIGLGVGFASAAWRRCCVLLNRQE